MTIASIGEIGKARSGGTPQASIGFRPHNVVIPARTLLIAQIAKDNVQTSDGPTTEVLSVYDRALSPWTRAYEYCNGNSPAGAGVVVAVWYALVDAAIQDIDQQFTATFSTAVADASMRIWGFSFGSNTIPAFGGVQTSANDASAFGSLAINGLSSREYLFLRTTAVEGAPTPTQSSNFTAMPISGPNSMSVWGEYRILTGTGATSNPSSTGTNDNANIFLAFHEALAASMMFSAPTF